MGAPGVITSAVKRSLERAESNCLGWAVLFRVVRRDFVFLEGRARTCAWIGDQGWSHLVVGQAGQ